MTSRTAADAPDLSTRTGLLLAATVLLSRLPFVSAGYGTDTDTWKLASAIRNIAATGHYTVSRLPGYPLMEWLCAPLSAHGPWACNTMSALAAAACAWLSARLFAQHGVRDAALAGLAVTCIPAAWIASTSSIDYLWALAFVLAAWLDARAGRAVRAGIWLGMATGTRLTSGPLLLPLAWLVWHATENARVRRTGSFAALAIAVGAAWYVPSFQIRGWGFLQYSEIRGGHSTVFDFLGGLTHLGSSGIPVALIAGQSTVLLWGVVGCVALGLALLAWPWQSRSASRAGQLGATTGWAIVAMVAYEGLLYLRLPHDEGYLLPVVPFALLALAAALTPRRFAAVCVALIVSPFLLGVDLDPPKKGLAPRDRGIFEIRIPISGETVVIEPLRGPALRDLAKRRRMQEVERGLRAWWPLRPAEFRLVTGNMNAMVYALFYPIDVPNTSCASSFTTDELRRAREAGVPIYVLPGVRERSRKSEGPHSVDGIPDLEFPVTARR